MLIYWICNLILFYAIASEGFKNLSPRDWESLNYIAGAWISLVVMFIIAIIISFIFGIPIDNIIGCTGTGGCFPERIN